MAKIGFIGIGNMAEAVIKGIITAEVYQPAEILVSDIRSDRLKQVCDQYKIVSAPINKDIARSVDLLVLSVKPQNMVDVLEEIKGVISPDLLVVSIAAGFVTSRIQQILGDVPVIRVMPNTPALIAVGAAGLYATKQAEKRLPEVEKIFSAVGLAVVVKDEKLMDIVTAVSGSGPAYFFLLMEEMIKSAEKLGLPDELAEKLVLQTAQGAGLLAVEARGRNESPAVLRKKVTSPGGTTQAALKVFSQCSFEQMVYDAVKAAADRSEELSSG
ncbi:MAG: pyrroline-5-carboxylate reductase [Sedimentisphaerales bacterium]|nr:pyrroline-5-carboxylate reductase [Sedimentisphaerales bacterium]